MLLDRAYLYLAIPAGVQALLLASFYYLGFGLGEGVIVYYLPVLIASAVLMLGHRHLLSVLAGASSLSLTAADRWVCLSFSWLIVLFGALDLLVNGVKILNPGTYAEFHGYGRYFRHFSIMCWVLIPVSLLCSRSRAVKLFFITYALIFPVIIVDRNRLLLSFFAFFFCYVIYCNGWKRRNLNVIVLLVVVLAFGGLGAYRSGASFEVETSGKFLADGFLPLRDSFFLLPSLLRQIVLYVTTPIVNYSLVYSVDFSNADFFLSQMSPFGREEYDAYPYSPVLVQRFNVGTEFFPQLMYGGVFFSSFSFVFMIVCFVFSVLFLRSSKSIFALVIFLKFAHTIIFMGFAPQFFIFYNFAFVFLFLLLQFFSRTLTALARLNAINRSIPIGCDRTRVR
jgi:hypothetical protein|tara:strand:- start:2015 stop:3199 length:1185 start_codon:yes stop_codon:yes gene_type:complete